MRHLDLNLLHTFKTIVECNSQSLAAQRLHKTQAAISIQLKKLEDNIGRRLLDRSPQGTQLTADGELLLQYAQRMLAVSEEAIRAFSLDDIVGTVRFGIPDDYASAFLPQVLKRFRKAYPNVQIKIRNDISHNLFAALEQGELDLALVTRREGDVGGELLRCEALHWVVADDSALVSDMPVPLALYPHGCSYRRHILNALTAAQRAYEITYECSGVMGVNLALDSGLAVAATTESLIATNWRILDAAEFRLPTLGMIMIELRTSKSGSSPAALRFAEEVRAHVQQPSVGVDRINCAGSTCAEGSEPARTTPVSSPCR